MTLDQAEARPATLSRLVGSEPSTGVVEALVAVTGVRDDVGDVITPGAFRRTLEERRPKVVLGTTGTARSGACST